MEMGMEKTGKGKFLWLLGAALLVLWGLSRVMPIGWHTPQPGRARVSDAPPMDTSLDEPFREISIHCYDEHADQCDEVVDEINDDGRFCGGLCPDGRRRYACKASNGLWAVLVGEGQRVITAYYTDDAEYARRIQSMCSDWNVAHP